MVNLLPRKALSTKHSILCVDDEHQILEALALTLGRRYQIEMAQSGQAALEILRAMPDTAVIISDMRMPSMNGAQFLAASRKIAPNARRILLTGHADTASAVLAVNEGGIFRFLTKPCPFATLVDAVDAAIADFEEDSREQSAIRRTVKRELLSHDPLTGLTSRQSLLERLDLCRTEGATGEWQAEAIFLIEIGDVEELSAGYDSNLADKLIRWAATRLQEAIPTAQCLARYREATFVALVVPAAPSDAILKSHAADLIAALDHMVDIDGVHVQMRAAIGIARIAVGSDPRGALRHAELAAREARHDRNDAVRLFSQDAVVENERRRDTVHALRSAITKQLLSLYYQPIIDTEHHRVYSVEALARWDDPQLGTVSPSLFIPLAEETGLMNSLGEWVLNRACAEGRALCGPIFPRVSVNVSVAQILDGGFLDGLHKAIETSGLEPSALEMELTETVFAKDLDLVCQVLSNVRRLGVRVAIDDFGAGYSSLTYLTRLPVDVLKIDRSFVQDLDRGGKAIIGATLAVARELHMEVIVEGVETAQELEGVRALGANKIQGFYFARPMPAARLLDWYEKFDEQRGKVRP